MGKILVGFLKNQTYNIKYVFRIFFDASYRTGLANRRVGNQSLVVAICVCFC